MAFVLFPAAALRSPAKGVSLQSPRAHRRPRAAVCACARPADGSAHGDAPPARDPAAALAKRRELASMAVSEAECERLGAGEEESEDGPPPPPPPPPPPASARSPAATARAGVAPRAVRANMHKTGTRVHLLPCPGDAPPSTRRYILCSGCATAYVGNAVTAPTEVRCPQCKQSFSTSPAALFVAVDPLVVAADAKIASQARARREAGPNEIVCKHFGACPGCALQSDVSRPMVAREADAFARNALGALQPLSVEMGPSTGWRTHAKLAIRPAGTGLFKTRSHDVVEIPDCAVHHPAINAAAAALQKAIKACGVRPYDEVRMMGRARYALFTVERQSGRVQVTVVWNAASWKEANPVAPRLGAEYWANNRDLLHSVWFNWNTSSGNAITSQKDDAFYLMHGPALIGELVAGARVYFAPTVFRQANLDAFEALIIPRLLSYIPKGSALVELYGGVGVISLAALRRQADLQLRSVTVAEINQFAAAPFRRSLAQFDRAVRERVTYVVGSDDDTVGRAVGEDADVVIVDPPRVGVSEVCMSELAAPPPGSPLRRLIYVSCGFEAFKRDSRRLVSGGWSVRALHGYVLFPGSNHIEMLAVFDRRPR